ncbi:MAG TPA: amidase family protein [Gaiellaceae bacterium]|nr:amidase family protein [Gaiellaceae bacterium]
MQPLDDFADAVAVAEAVRRRDVSPVEVVAATLERISRLDGEVNSIVVVLAEQALAEARRAETAAAAGEEVGPLHGVPFSVKDVLWLRDAPATNGSRALHDFTPAVDAVAVARLREAGAIPVGKTNNPELCFAGVTDNRVYGLTRNPRDLSRTPGGSSGGAGASLALGLTPLALGTDGGGSVRIPSSFCGVAGLKPSYGLVPGTPGFRGWRSLSVVGPMARTTRDLALVLSVLAGFHPSDDTTVELPLGEYARAVAEANGDDLRVAVSADLGFAPLEPGVRQAFETAIGRLGGAGWKLEEAHPPTGDPVDLWNLVAACEGYAAHRDLLEHHREELEPGTVDALSAGERYSAADYLDATEERAGFVRSWLEFLDRYDVLLTPTMQLTAFPVGSASPATIGDHRVDPERDDWCVFCYPANLAGLPAASVPCGLDERGLPVGLQIVGGRFRDETVLRTAAAFEALQPWPRGAPDPPSEV